MDDALAAVQADLAAGEWARARKRLEERFRQGAPASRAWAVAAEACGASGAALQAWRFRD